MHAYWGREKLKSSILYSIELGFAGQSRLNQVSKALSADNVCDGCRASMRTLREWQTMSLATWAGACSG